MTVDLRAARAFAVIAVSSVCLSAAGCSLINGDFAPRTVAPTAANTAPVGATPLDVRPAVLVQEGVTASVATTSAPKPSTVEGLPLLPNTGTTLTAATSGQLSPDEKARVIAELEALARGEVPVTSATTRKPALRP